MSTGPATKMWDFITGTYRSVEARLSIEDITPATLEAMDAAATVMGRQELAQQVRVRSRARYRDSDDFDLCTHTVSLGLQEEEELLWTLLDRAIQRRQEAGNG